MANSSNTYSERRETLLISSGDVAEMIRCLMAKKSPIKIQAGGWSMDPFIRDQDVLTIAPLSRDMIKLGEIVAFKVQKKDKSFRLGMHRVVQVLDRENYLIKGDNTSPDPDGIVPRNQILGKVIKIERNNKTIRLGVSQGGGRARPLVKAQSSGTPDNFHEKIEIRFQAQKIPMISRPTIWTTILEHFKKNEFEKKRHPISFDFDITARCNNDCRHCYINVPPDSPEHIEKELSLSQIERIADEAVSMGTLWCLLSGGEPLLREDFDDIYVMLKRKGLLLSLYTNATLITPHRIQLLKRYPPRDIEITVYGVTKETFGKVTSRPENFNAFKRGLKLLLDNNIPVRLKAMIMRSNIHEFSEIAAFCRRYTKDFFRFDPHLHLRYDGNPERNRRILAERLTPQEIAALDHKDPSRSASLQKDCHIYIRDSSNNENDKRLFCCGLGRNSFSVGFDGMFRLCPSLCAPMCMYDLKNGSLAEAWTTFAPRIMSMTTSDPEIGLKCHRCEIINLCQWCPANAHLESGRLEYRPDYFCEVARARSEALKSRLVSDSE